jgi:AraC-like DNA-binding protein
MLAGMNQPLRVFDGRFGRLKLVEARAGLALAACPEPQVLCKLEGADLALRPSSPEALPASELTRGRILFLNPGEHWLAPAPAAEEGAGRPRAQLLLLQASPAWLEARFPAAFEDERRPFPAAWEEITARIRQLADILAVEALNDQFLSPDRLEFMVEDMMLSIVETYLARRRQNARFWRGSPFADSRIRRALALLRARPNKELSMDELASRVGLSRSRFYDLFQLSTGHSPRAYLDKLCIESAIARLSSGRAKIAEVSAELGFSAQSNFTRFFQHQVGIPPSEYRAALRRASGPESDAEG